MGKSATEWNKTLPSAVVENDHTYRLRRVHLCENHGDCLCENRKKVSDKLEFRRFAYKACTGSFKHTKSESRGPGV